MEKKIKDGGVYSYAELEYKVASGQNKEATLWDRVSFSPKALWKLKGWLLAFGIGAEQDLPIDKGVDGQLVIDEESLFSLCKELIHGKACDVSVVVAEPDAEGKAKGWKTKNEITEYREAKDSMRKAWEE